VRRVSLLVIGMLTAVALALTAVIWIMFTDLNRLRTEETAGAEALAAARSVASAMLSYDYRTIEQDFARAGGYTAGGLTWHYKQLATTLVPQARKERTVQQATVAGAGVESIGSDRVEVLLFMSMSTVRTLPGEKEPRRQVSQNRALFVMVKKDSRWLVAELSTLLGSPPRP
jgi:Mce-associated membrane protein